MENKNLTAVEWLKEQLECFGNKHELQMSWATVDELVEQAKEMEKEQHGQTWDKSLDNLKARGMNEMRAYCDFDDYYQETYK